MQRPEKLRGVQWISYADLARDVAAWAQQLPQDIALVAGIPRSGLTVAHMLAAELGVPAVQVLARPFRQSSGRPLQSRRGRTLVVDDTASCGVTMREIRSQIPGPACCGAVYARTGAHPFLDYWFAPHAEPDWLVVTQWNLFSHQDSKWVIVEADALFADGKTRHLPQAPLGGIVSPTGSREEIESWLTANGCPPCEIRTGVPLVESYHQFPNAALLVTRHDESARELALQTGRATLSTEAWIAYESHWS